MLVFVYCSIVREFYYSGLCQCDAEQAFVQCELEEEKMFSACHKVAAVYLVL